MRFEYVLFNIVVLAGPVAASFRKRLRFAPLWPTVLLTNAIVALPYLLWDSAVTGKHWWFNEKFTLPIRIAGLPPGEWMFFFSVPFACLFVWENLRQSWKADPWTPLKHAPLLLLLLVPMGAAVYTTGKGCTATALVFLGCAGAVDILLRTWLLRRPLTYAFLGIVLLLTFVFDGYLTWRPIVLYDYSYQLNLLVWTTPIEDFLYALSLILLNAIVYERLTQNRRTK